MVIMLNRGFVMALATSVRIIEELSLSFPRTLILHSNNSYILPQLRDADQVPGGSRSYRCIHTSSQSHRRAPRNIGHVRNILQDSIIPPVKVHVVAHMWTHVNNRSPCLAKWQWQRISITHSLGRDHCKPPARIQLFNLPLCNGSERRRTMHRVPPSRYRHDSVPFHLRAGGHGRILCTEDAGCDRLGKPLETNDSLSLALFAQRAPPTGR
ncbi:hypothetical protein EDD16DRAFT_1065125 [Pisolithus croceorrhizus]|nr:hypothetical protein EDD16DRAFT_1065125 [Pisolithus croceorrhizus]